MELQYIKIHILHICINVCVCMYVYITDIGEIHIYLYTHLYFWLLELFECKFNNVYGCCARIVNSE